MSVKPPWKRQYGRWVHISPKRWWSFKAHRAAKTLATVTDTEVDREMVCLNSDSPIALLTAFQRIQNRHNRERMERAQELRERVREMEATKA